MATNTVLEITNQGRFYLTFLFPGFADETSIYFFLLQNQQQIINGMMIFNDIQNKYNSQKRRITTKDYRCYRILFVLKVFSSIFLLLSRLEVINLVLFVNREILSLLIITLVTNIYNKTSFMNVRNFKCKLLLIRI